MPSLRHAKVKELFLQARRLDGQAREAFLRQECGDDTKLNEEVTSLLRHDHSQTILERRAAPVLPAAGRIRRSGLASSVEASAVKVLQLIFATRVRCFAIAIAGLAVLLVLAAWTFWEMQRSSRSIAESDLQTILNADVKALELWIEEKKKDVRLWSSRPEISGAVRRLVQIAAEHLEPREHLLAAPELSELRAYSEAYNRLVGGPEQDAVISRGGRMLAAADDALVGAKINAEGVARLVSVFEGQTVFVRPQPRGAFTASHPDQYTPIVIVVAPIYDWAGDQDQVVAAAAFGFPADGEFTEILSVARKGESGETYIFDQHGLLLSESRFDDAMRAAGRLPEDPRSRSIFRVEIRDPGPQPGRLSSVEAAARPLTRLAAQATAAGRKGSGAELQGVIVEPYRNYRGARVIGAWKWLPAYDFAIATEVEVAEQFKPMLYPMIADWIRFGIVAACFASLFAAAVWISTLRRDIEEARQLGQYTLEEKVGEGGMSVVYRARHALLKRPAAIKLLRSEVMTAATAARFEREVQVASSLTHPNTIDIFDFGRSDDGTCYCVMEFLEGRTLNEVVRDEGPLSPLRVGRILGQAAGSLAEAHQRGLVHRDVKPSNIMLCEQGGIRDFVKVLDFGLVRPVVDSTTQLTQSGLVVGTPAYLSPERITDANHVDHRSDIYSLGAVGYYLLTGREVHRAQSLERLVQQILDGERQRPAAEAPASVPAELDELIYRCLAHDPQDRPADMQAFLESIRALGVGGAAV